MRILYVVPYVPGLVRVRSYNLIRALSDRGHEVVVATAWSDDGERAEVEELRSCCSEVHAVRLPVWPPNGRVLGWRRQARFRHEARSAK